MLAECGPYAERESARGGAALLQTGAVPAQQVDCDRVVAAVRGSTRAHAPAAIVHGR
jgi:uncharacterized Zn finger protein